VLPISLVVLTGLFVIQSKGTARVGAVFGPVMLFWFATLGVLGAMNVVRHPDVLQAFNPLHAIFFCGQQGHRFSGSGCDRAGDHRREALYADMGHFGRRPIKLAWFGFVFPALYLNYLGQGALILDDPSAVKNPFYLLVPDPLLYPMVGLSTLATIIASQAVISGAFSLTKQAVSWAIRPGCMSFTPLKGGRSDLCSECELDAVGRGDCPGPGFRSSSALASAYGIAVTLTMMIDTVLAFVVVRALWKWGGVPPWPLSPCSLPWISPSLPRIRSRSLMGAGFRWSWVCSSTPC
jgi:KUP system potassium uptake protein